MPQDVVECRPLSIGARYIYPFLTLYAVDQVKHWEIDFGKVWDVLGISMEMFWIHMRDLEKHGFIKLVTTREEVKEGAHEGKIHFHFKGNIDYELRRKKRNGRN